MKVTTKAAVQPASQLFKKVAPASLLGTKPIKKTLTSYLEQNEVMNRVVMDIFGWGGPGILFARNLYERVERSLDIGLWLVAGVIFPLTLDQLINKRQTVKLKQRFPKAFLNTVEKAQPIGIPFEWLNTQSIQKIPKSKLAPYGLKQIPKSMLNHIRKTKIFYILLADMLLMASKGQGYFWGKNALTEFLTGKKGFVGEFNYAKEEYLAKKAKEYESSRKKRMLASILIGYGSAIALPILIYQSVKTPNPKGIFKAFKKIVPAFNYNDTIYMSKWILMWHTLFNWNFASILSSRDSHEFRENAVRTFTLLGVCTIGDDILTGMIAKYLNRLSIRKYKMPILSAKKAIFGLPRLMPIPEIIKKYGVNSGAYRLARQNFWIGIVGACAAINSLLPILNNYYTKQKVLREQQTTGQLSPKQPIQPPQTKWVPAHISVPNFPAQSDQEQWARPY